MLEVNQQTINLGKLKFGQPHSFKYTIKNNYDGNLKINMLSRGCNSCTVASADKNELFPGESTDINVTFTPGSTGIQEKRITIEHMVDGKIKPGLTLSFKALVNG